MTSIPPTDMDSFLERVGRAERLDLAAAMGCPDDRVLVAYRTKTLGAEEMASLEAHLVECDACRRLLAALAEPVPAHLLRWSEAEVDAASPRPHAARWGRTARVAAPLTAAAAAILAVVLAREIMFPGNSVPHYTVSIAGRIDQVRGAEKKVAEPLDQVAEPLDEFAPSSQIRLEWSPTQTLEGPPPFSTVFREGPDFSLRRVAIPAVSHGGGVFSWDALAKDVFGDAFGRQRLYLVLGSSEGELGRLDGQSPEVLDIRKYPHWVFELDYREHP